MVSPVLQGFSTHVSPALTGSEPANSVWDPTNPRYFSGTGCEAKATAVPLTGYVSHAQLLVNDTVVEEYWDSAAPGKPSPLPTDGSVVTGTNLTSATVKALFDSTHFADSSSITIKLKVTDSKGGYYEATVAQLAYNKAFVMANNTFGDNGTLNISDVSNVLTQSNYFAFTSTQLHKPMILSLLPLQTVFYADTHGGTSQFDHCFATGENAQVDSQGNNIPGTGDTPDNIIGPIELGGSIRSKNSLEPPYNLVELDACSTLGNKLESSTGANDTGLCQNFSIPLPGSASDRALLGFNWPTFTWVQNVNWTGRLWAGLAHGATLRDTILLAAADGPPIGPATMIGGVYLPGAVTSVNPVIQGDENMTLHGVYGTVGTHQFDPSKNMDYIYTKPGWLAALK